MTRALPRPVRWLIDRMGLDALTQFIREHRVPPELSGRWGWAYVFGSAAATALGVQVITGIALATKYVPTPEAAYESLAYITFDTRWGWFLRAMHFFGASAMILLICLHMTRVVLTGSYKFPREMQWISGIAMFVVVFFMAWTGQLLRFNEDGFWTVVVGSRFAERVPFIGDWFAMQVLGGHNVGGPTLTRFYALHTMILPLTVGALLALHLYLVVHNGISELPQAHRKVDREGYRAWYTRLKAEAGARYVPDTIWREALTSAVVVAGILALAWFFGARPLGNPPDPTSLHVDPRPDWFVAWYYALLWVKPRHAEDLFMVHLPLLALLALILLPIVAPGGERHPARRPWAVVAVVLALVGFGWLSVLGARAPWVPDVDVVALGPAELGEVDEKTLRGASLFAERGCQTCHQVMGQGGRYGPDLTAVATRLSPQEIAARTILGLRDMPSFGHLLTEAELDDIVHFLVALEER